MRESRSICPDLVGLAALTLAGCFTPNETDPHVAATDEGSSGEMGDTDTTPSTSADTTDGSPTSDTNDTDTTDTDATDTAATDPTNTDATDADATDSDPTEADATDSDPTDTDATTSDDGPTTTDGGVDPFCGDGNVDPGEDCDDGTDNGPGQECLASCVANVCGDGDILAGDEACDDGAGNVLAVGACAPDCSRVIEEREIRISSQFSNGDFGNNPVAFADSHCTIGHAAMFVYPGVREATTVPYESVGSIDWVLQPYTAYTRFDGTLIWITDDTALLGVRNGVAMPLEETIGVCSPLCALWYPISGLNNDWTTSADQDCNGWTEDVGSSVSYGDSYDDQEFLNTSTQDCASWGGVVVYCVEQ